MMHKNTMCTQGHYVISFCVLCMVFMCKFVNESLLYLMGCKI